jgi:hypothetical protein
MVSVRCRKSLQVSTNGAASMRPTAAACLGVAQAERQAGMDMDVPVWRVQKLLPGDELDVPSRERAGRDVPGLPAKCALNGMQCSKRVEATTTSIEGWPATAEGRRRVTFSTRCRADCTSGASPPSAIMTALKHARMRAGGRVWWTAVDCSAAGIDGALGRQRTARQAISDQAASSGGFLRLARRVTSPRALLFL